MKLARIKQIIREEIEEIGDTSKGLEKIGASYQRNIRRASDAMLSGDEKNARRYSANARLARLTSKNNWKQPYVASPDFDKEDNEDAFYRGMRTQM